ncbi:hypothetical protein R3P38DRAFT_3192388 [Favolaschia claudopus]|uniref:Uncharacterized protein n=1 Tax=Favolaschia claudopus TaxID=2862362 RepID=A0AAW0BIB7_9AGAR
MHSLPKPFVCDIHALLSSALSLERLSLIYVDPHMIDLANMSQDRLLNPPSVALDNVYHIHFAMSHLRCHYFFDSLVTPNLRSFVLQVNNEHDLLPFVTASRERFLSVKTLVLVCHLSCSDLLAQVLQCFPRLVELDGSRSPAFTMAFHGVALYHPKVVPRLRKIRFSEFSLPIVRDILQCRASTELRLHGGTVSTDVYRSLVWRTYRLLDNIVVPVYDRATD